VSCYCHPHSTTQHPSDIFTVLPRLLTALRAALPVKKTFVESLILSYAIPRPRPAHIISSGSKTRDPPTRAATEELGTQLYYTSDSKLSVSRSLNFEKMCHDKPGHNDTREPITLLCVGSCLSLSVSWLYIFASLLLIRYVSVPHGTETTKLLEANDKE